MMSIAVRSASPDEESAVSAVIALAFTTDPMARWSLSDAQTYLAVMPMIRAFGAAAYDSGSAYVSDDFGGAALWLPPGAEPDIETLEHLIRANANPAILSDVDAIFEAMAHYHPEVPHWYLPLIGADPARQGQGIGSALMHHALARCDREGTAAYLESSNPRNIALYQRHGFEILGTIQAGSSPVLTPMLRPPRPAASRSDQVAGSQSPGDRAAGDSGAVADDLLNDHEYPKGTSQAWITSRQVRTLARRPEADIAPGLHRSVSDKRSRVELVR